MVSDGIFGGMVLIIFTTAGGLYMRSPPLKLYTENFRHRGGSL